MRLALRRKKIFLQFYILPRNKNPKSFFHGLTENTNTITKGKFSSVIINPFILNKKQLSLHFWKAPKNNNTCSGLMETSAYNCIFRWRHLLWMHWSLLMHAHSILKFNFRGRDFSAYQVFMACFDWLLYFSSNTCWLLN